MADYSSTIWNYLLNKIGNEYGVAGLMGNLYAESALQPNNLQNTYETSLGYTDTSYTSAVDSGAYSESSFVNDSAGYGLAQWTYYSRKQALYNMYKSGGYSSIGSIDLALDYLWHELQNSYPSVLSVLKSASSVRVASDTVLHDFENPKDQSTSVEEKREEYSLKYYNQFANGSEVSFEPRLDSSGIEGAIYWYSGNPFYLSGYGLPNCTCYAWGRFWEISDKDGNGSNKPTLPTGDGGEWFPAVTGYETGTTPKLGAVICWSKSGGAGHVAIVEQILDNGDIVTSNSAYQSTFFYTKTIYKADGYNFGNYVFQGFIYNPHVSEGGSEPVVPDKPPYVPPKNKRKKFNFILFQRNRRLNQWTGKPF